MPPQTDMRQRKYGESASGERMAKRFTCSVTSTVKVSPVLHDISIIMGAFTTTFKMHGAFICGSPPILPEAWFDVLLPTHDMTNLRALFDECFNIQQ